MDETQAVETLSDAASSASAGTVEVVEETVQAVDMQGVLSAIDGVVNSVDGLTVSFGDGLQDLSTLVAGLATVQMYTLLIQLVMTGVLLALVFVVALRRL